MNILSKHSASAANFAFNGCGEVSQESIRAPRENGAAEVLSQTKIKENKESSVTNTCSQPLKSGCTWRHEENVFSQFTDKPTAAAADKATRLFLKRHHELPENTRNESPIQLLLRKAGAPVGRTSKISSDVDIAPYFTQSSVTAGRRWSCHCSCTSNVLNATRCSKAQLDHLFRQSVHMKQDPVKAR